MMDRKLELTAEEFIRCLRLSPSVREFHHAKILFQKDPEVRTLQEEYVALSQEFQKKQFGGTLTQEDITRIKKIQADLGRHPVIIRYSEAREKVAGLLKNCNAIMSEMLGFDFAATGAPTGSC